MLSSRLQESAGRQEITTPFGVTLRAAMGRYVAIGDLVRAPGIDDCSPKMVAEVLYVGTRRDRPGNWCLLRFKGQDRPGALIAEDELGPISTHMAPGANKAQTGTLGMMPAHW